MPQNLPGAGGAIVAGQLYNIAPKDGTVMGIPFASVILDPLLVTGRKEYDPRKFNYVGNAQSEVLVCFLRKDAPVKTLADLKSKELILGSSAPGSPSYDLPIVAKNVLGLNIKMVTGYKGSREVTLAMESGELHGTCGLSWTTLKVQYPTIVKNEAFGYVFAQEDLVGLPKLNKEGVPLMMQLATEEKQRQALAMIYAQNGFARPFILPPGVPADRVALLRKAFDETMRDPETVADAERMNIDLNPATGDFVQQAVAKMYETPPEVIETVKKALGRTGG
jgi:tripartite-type tricarboxylate transporter receptor subunit TctC